MPGEAADCTAFEEVIAVAEERPTRATISDAVRASLHEAGISPCIPRKSDCQGRNRRVYRERNRIERMIGHLKINRIIATRYDKLARGSGPTWPRSGSGREKAGQRGGLLHPVRHLRLVELVAFVDVDVPRVLALAGAGRDGS
jgi:hypothetical protein